MSTETSEAISKIAKLTAQWQRFSLCMLVQEGELFREIVIEWSKSGIEVRLKEAPGYMQGPVERVPSVAAAFSKAYTLISAMTPIIESCDGDDELSTAVRAAWCELFGIEVSTIKPMTRAEVVAYTKSAVNNSLLTLLQRGGDDAVKKWNSRPLGEKLDSGIDFTKMDLSGKDLTGIHLKNLDWSGGNFDGSQMFQATLTDSQCAKSTFRKSYLEKANLSGINASRADFSQACLKNVFCYKGNFKSAILKGADLSDSNFKEGDICGADFTGSTTCGANFAKTKYDEKTKLPPDFPLGQMIWKGAGVDPRREEELKNALSQGVSDYDGFIEQIDKNFDSERIDKALNMLKKERFQLFSQISPEEVIGIVRSQSDEELVYSCLLTAQGNYTCCTQNLKPCGGLKGALCKHLLVLIIGLTKSQALEPNQAATWVLSSKFHQPKIDKDVMSAIFLKYKGALVGEIDWRPTETIPEDYYT